MTILGWLSKTHTKQPTANESTSPSRGFIGRLDSQKGFDLLLESLVEVLEESGELTDRFGWGAEMKNPKNPKNTKQVS